MKLCRLISLVMAFMVLFSALSIVSADEINTNLIVSSEVESSSKVFDYNSYSESNKQMAASTQEISIKAKDYITANGATLNNSVVDSVEYIKWTNESGEVSWRINVPQDALYTIGLNYYNLPGREDRIELGVKIDGSYPFDEAENIELNRLFADDGDVRVDGYGNEFAPNQIEIFEFQKNFFCDNSGSYLKPYEFKLSKGTHIITLVSINEPLGIESLILGVPEKDAPTYSEYLSSVKSDDKRYDGEIIAVEGEDAEIKTDISLVPSSDNTSASVNPASASTNKINYIGGNWKNVGDTLTWTINIEKSAWYKIGFHYRQHTLLNGLSYRKLQIDDQVLFDEMGSIGFPYGSSWEFKTLQTEKQEDALVYLKEGKHEISMSVTLGDVADISRQLSDIVASLGSMYRDMVKITGEDPDINRSYDLFSQIPDLKEKLEFNSSEIERLSDEYEKLSGSKGGTTVATMRAMSAVMERMLEYDYQAHQYIKNYYTSYSSIGALVYEMRNMPLDIDAIYLMSPDDDFEQLEVSFFENIKFSVLKFFYSFIIDYSSITGSTGEKGLNLWVNWGLDQSRALNSLIESSFTANTNIPVSVKVTNATVIQAILSGNGPDMVLHMSRSEPVNLAMRGALYDLTKFEDYENVIEQFMPSATKPFEFNGGVYALPDTQSFYTLFYRKDIFEELEVTVPRTWDEFFATAAVIQRNNMGVGLPYTQITAATQINAGSGSLSLFPTLLLQHGGSMYNENQSGVTFDRAETINAFNFWTDFYTEYAFPVTYDFYNRFRVGTMPMGIQPYTMHNTISVLAPEISGQWGIAEIPGFLQEDGTIDNTQVGGSTGCVILKDSKNIDNAWKFLKWWVSEDTQYRYTRDVESILGATARVATSNVNALKKLGWSKSDLAVLTDSWNDVEEMAEIPGGYYIPRAIDQCFWNVIYNSKLSNDVLAEWQISVNEEIREKRQEYGIK